VPKNCHICKAEVKNEFVFCPYCGARVSQSKKPSEQPTHKQPGLHLSNAQILLIFVVIVGIVLIGLLITGTFDSPVSNTATANNNTQQNLTQGPGLAEINRINELRDYVKNNEGDKEKIVELGHLLMDNGFNEDAIKYYDMYLKLDPKNPDVIIDKGVCYFNLQQYNKAEEIMLKGLEIKPNHIIGTYNLGIVNLGKQNRKKAKEWFRKVIELDPNSDYAKQAQQLLESH
jgi:cytochrome c-type biogenesis protein CcmH/NrfG